VQRTDFILACNLYSGVLVLPRVMNSEDWTVAVSPPLQGPRKDIKTLRV